MPTSYFLAVLIRPRGPKGGDVISTSLVVSKSHVNEAEHADSDAKRVSWRCRISD